MHLVCPLLFCLGSLEPPHRLERLDLPNRSCLDYLGLLVRLVRLVYLEYLGHLGHLYVPALPVFLFFLDYLEDQHFLVNL